uniref:SJCHGC04047 protein n=1 Tax=Schistosoma japonicum TaxID=6182 RepID=Q5D9S1_SCHJA|nr:SJCHGC04047 protein [Schistosoma japonicum]
MVNMDPATMITGTTPEDLTNIDIPTWMGRSVTAPKMRLVELSAYMISSTSKSLSNTTINDFHLTATHNSAANQHNFVHIGPILNEQLYTDPNLEQVDASQIWDKFPEDSLKELMEHGPTNTFFLVKFWVCFDKFFWEELYVYELCTAVIKMVYNDLSDYLLI